MRRRLLELPARGGCAQAVGNAAVAGSVAAGCAAQCPPSVARVAGFASAGVAAWSAGADGGSLGTARRGVVAAAASRDAAERGAAAGNEACPPLVLAVLCCDDSADGEQIAQAALQNPSCPAHALVVAVSAPVEDWESPDRVESAASNANLPTCILAEAAQQSDSAARQGAALNPACPPRLLAGMISDPALGVRICAASNLSCPPEALAMIDETNDELEVLESAAANPNCEPWLIEEFTRYVDEEIRSAVLSNPSCPPAIFRDLIDNDAYVEPADAARSPLADDALLDQIAGEPGDANRYRRLIVARNPNTSPKTLARIAADPDADLRRAAVLHPGCPIDTLAALVVDPDAETAFCARAAFAAATRARHDRSLVGSG